MDSSEDPVQVRRQWDDWRVARYPLRQVSGFHWSDVSGGVGRSTPRFFVRGYVACNAMIDGELAHSCKHGPPPHQIKVCVTKKGNERLWARIEKLAGRRPNVPSARDQVVALAQGLRAAMQEGRKRRAR